MCNKVEKLRQEYFAIMDVLASGRDNLSNEALKAHEARLSEIEEQILEQILKEES